MPIRAAGPSPRWQADPTVIMYNSGVELHIAAAKVNKYATSESGDTLEIIERPGGGLSVVLADGQRSGKSAKRISNLVVRKVISLLAEGVRDGAAARAASDYLYHERHGKVMATLNILSVDLQTRTLVITRNNPAPVYIARGAAISALDEEAQPVGVYRNTRPVIHEEKLEVGLSVLAFTDGLSHAGDRRSQRLDIQSCFADLATSPGRSVQEISDGLLDAALQLDQGRPIDDISVLVLQVTERSGDEVRQIAVRLPLGP